MNNKRLLGLKDDLYAKSFLCGMSIYVNSCYASSDDESYHFEIISGKPCIEFLNYLYDFADDMDILYRNGYHVIKVCFK